MLVSYNKCDSRSDQMERRGIVLLETGRNSSCYRVAMSVAELHPSGFMENQKWKVMNLDT